MYEIKPDITENYILDYLTEAQIIEYYLGIPVVFNKLVRSPLRTDKKPTANFYIDNAGRLIFKDFNGTCFHGNYLEVVKKKTGLPFREALIDIHEKMILNKEIEPLPEYQKIKYEKKQKILQVKRRQLNDFDLSYWNSFGISKETLDLYKVTGLQTLWVDGKILYSATQRDIGYLYDFEDEVYKAYFPFRTDFRFLGNVTKYVIQGYNQLPLKGKLLIVTKALKDVMTLRELGFIAVAPQAESVLISENQMLELKTRFKKIVSFMDFDYTGVCLMNKMKKLYDIPPYTLTNGRFYTIDYQAKDISDLVKLLGKEKVIKLIQEKL